MNKNFQDFIKKNLYMRFWYLSYMHILLLGSDLVELKTENIRFYAALWQREIIIT